MRRAVNEERKRFDGRGADGKSGVMAQGEARGERGEGEVLMAEL